MLDDYSHRQVIVENAWNICLHTSSGSEGLQQSQLDLAWLGAAPPLRPESTEASFHPLRGGQGIQSSLSSLVGQRFPTSDTLRVELGMPLACVIDATEVERLNNSGACDYFPTRIHDARR